MIKSLFRIVAFLFLAAGFVAAVMDGARSLANSTLDYAPASMTVAWFLGERFNQWQPAVERNLHPLLWDPVLVNLMALPTSLVLLLLGGAAYRIGRRSVSTIGHVMRN